MTIKHLSLLAVVLIGSLTASAQKIKRVPLPASQNPSNADLPISAAVWNGDTLYVSGWLDPDIKTHADTTSQVDFPQGIVEQDLCFPAAPCSHLRTCSQEDQWT